MHLLEFEKNVIFSWQVKDEEPKILKDFLQDKKFSKNIISKIKSEDYHLLVNNQAERVTQVLKTGDTVKVVLPKEEPNPTIAASSKPLDILFEDSHLLIVNKSAGVYSMPAPSHREDTMANQVRGYMEKSGSPYKKIHIVSRLDRDTSGIMIFAKHAFAHSLMDKMLEDNGLTRYYQAIVQGTMANEQGVIDAPISRAKHSIVERIVSDGGKASVTEFWVEESFNNFSQLKIQLHTGRTHQIRVHFAHTNHPLLGDDLYGGKITHLNRQALHCEEIQFTHPLTEQTIKINAPMPEDLIEVIDHMRSEKRNWQEKN